MIKKISEILNKPINLALLREKIGFLHEEFVDIEDLNNFYLSHTHRVIYQIINSLEGENLKYAEMGASDS